MYGGYTLGESSLLVPVYPVSPADETHYRAMGENIDTLCQNKAQAIMNYLKSIKN